MSRARATAVAAVVAVVVAAVVIQASRGSGGGTPDPSEAAAPQASPGPPPDFPRPTNERERLARLLEIVLHADTDDALWARGKLVEAGDAGRELVVDTARAVLTSNVAFVEHALEVMLAAPRPDDLPLAVSALRSTDPQVVRRACTLLGRLGPSAKSAVPDLGNCAAAGAPPVPLHACDALARIGGDEAADALARVAASGEAALSSRTQAMLALGRLGGPRAVAALLKLWETTRGDERHAAAEALLTAGDRTPVEPLRTAWETGRDEIALALLAYAADDAALAELERRLRDPLETAVRRVEAIGRLEKYPAERKSALLRHVAGDGSQEQDVRVEAWDALVRSGEPDAAAELLRLLRSEGAAAQEDRYVAALVLGRLRRPEHATALLAAAAREDVSPEVRTKVLCALALGGSADGAPAIVDAMARDQAGLYDGPSASIDLEKCLAAPSRELGAALSPLVLAALHGERGPPGPRAKVQLLLIAGRVCGAEAAPTVEGFLGDAESQVRITAVRVLAYVHRPETVRALRAAWWTPQPPEVLRAIAGTLLRLSLDEVPR